VAGMTNRVLLPGQEHAGQAVGSAPVRSCIRKGDEERSRSRMCRRCTTKAKRRTASTWAWACSRSRRWRPQVSAQDPGADRIETSQRLPTVKDSGVGAEHLAGCMATRRRSRSRLRSSTAGRSLYVVPTVAAGWSINSPWDMADKTEASVELKRSRQRRRLPRDRFRDRTDGDRVNLVAGRAACVPYAVGKAECGTDAGRGQGCAWRQVNVHVATTTSTMT